MTGVGRAAGIGAAIAAELGADGWEVVTTGWAPYDEQMPWGADEQPAAMVQVDLANPSNGQLLYSNGGLQ